MQMQLGKERNLHMDLFQNDSNDSLLPTDQFKRKVLGLHLRKTTSEGFSTPLHDPEDSFLHILDSVKFQAGSNQP